MSISLNNHESRIKALENRPSGGTITGQVFGESGYVSFSNGFKMTWGKVWVPNRETPVVKMTYPFNTTTMSLLTTIDNSQYLAGDLADYAHVFNVTKSQFSIRVGVDGGRTVRWIAIGYLITNSIRSLLGGGLRWL